ncbi:MAG: glycosyltransferase, partial [Syntrophales bacterium LBB04]|nr:glycosyltransferase [Syntrophales bacterium LBB04]
MPDPLPLLASADIFVLSSRYEGFPMALMEAMSVGLPVVATDCTTGVREIMRPGVDGLLVAPLDKPALARAMGELMAGAPRRRDMAARAPEGLERFGLEPVLARWDELV